ncbi:MAG TPA: hypothetical protein ENK57_20775 [Polyangiaceae bacterium]|nr:hypothetical protein [Polyangiaceae bacterium]
MTVRTEHTFCRICEALCGLEVDVDDGRIVAVRPDVDHVTTDGFACIKGLRQHEMYDGRDRLQHPLKRVGDGYERIGWDQAFSEIGAKVKQLVGDHGPAAVAMYVGTAAGFSILHPIFAQGFMQGVGSQSMYATATQDCANKFAVARHVYGFPFTQPFPDVDRTDCLIVVGANPAVSKWSFLQVSHPIERLKQVADRGAALYFVDPRRTESAKVAGEHVFIRPGTDVFFYLAFLHELIATGGVDQAKVDEHMTGLPEVKALVSSWTPERAAEVTKIDASKLRDMVAAYRGAKGAALYCSTGVNMGSQGALAFWIQEVINAVSGNLDRAGGTLVGRGLVDFPKFARDNGILMREGRSRIGGLPTVNDALPGGVLADEILTEGPGQHRALFVTGGNPLITMANAGRLREAFEKLELLVCLDIQQGETASVAHYVLPCTTPFERPDLPFIFPLFLGMQSRPYLQATEAVAVPHGEQRDEASIYLDLCRAADAPIFGSRVAQRIFEGARALAPPSANGQPQVPQQTLLNLLLKLGGAPSFETMVRDHPHGIPRPNNRGGSYLGRRVLTDDGKVHLAPVELLAAAGELEAVFARERRDARRLKLITKRAVTTHNSWTHNHDRFIGRGTNYLYMHPNDAAEAGLEDGALADVRSETGVVRLPVKLLDELMPGCVALPHGWGHQSARGLSVAKRTTGVNVNLLAADGPGALEPVSGMAHLTGIVVDVRAAAGPLASDDWSGIAAE